MNDMSGKHVKIILLFLGALSWVQPIGSQIAVQQAARDLNISRTYFLGLLLGQASVHARVSHYLAAGHCLNALKSSLDVSRDLVAILPGLQITRFERPIYICSSDGRVGGDMQRHWDTYRVSLANDIIRLRDHASSLLQRKKRTWHLSFKLGEALGIAEGQAAVGESARAIVRDTLIQAQRIATVLKLETVVVTRIIMDIDAGQPIAPIYRRVVALREKYHNSLR